VTVTYNQTPTLYVDAKGTRLAYRSLGPDTGVPLVLLQHFTGTMDDWDPALVDALAKSRRLYVLDNAGVGRSGGTTPDSVQAMAHIVENFTEALRLETVDLLGFSLGSFIAQQILVERPQLVRRVVLAGAAPQGGVGTKDLPAVMADAMKKSGEQKLHPKVFLFFTDTPHGRTAATTFMERIGKHTVDPDPPVSDATVMAQMKAIVMWGSVPQNGAELAAIRQPVLIVNGSNDIMVPTVNSEELFRRISTAQLSLYPDSGHGALFQYHDLFVAQVDTFLR
jgi:pimeloyl-ACP methyl ester carboxylesterase